MGTISKNLRKHLESRFDALYLEITNQSRLTPYLDEKIKEACDILVALSVNDTKPFIDFVDATLAYMNARKKFIDYYINIASSMRNNVYDEKQGVYKTE